LCFVTIADYSIFSTQIIDNIRHSVDALKQLPPDVQLKARLVYYQGLQYSFAASTGIAAIAFITAMFINGKGLRKTTS
jgi:hypothetical protein